MGFEDFFENNRNKQGHYDKHDYRSGHRDSQSSYNEKESLIDWRTILMKIRMDKKLKMLVILAALVILAVVLVLIVVLMPVLMQLFDYISQNGLQGLVDYITAFLDKVLKGSQK